jgi:putative salt-induced outer membrane protein YdiY
MCFAGASPGRRPQGTGIVDLSTTVAIVVSILLRAVPVGTQAPPPVVMPGTRLPLPSPPPPLAKAQPAAWTGSIGLGISVTAGNADTSTFNATVDLATRADAANVFKAEALYLRGDRDGELNLNRLSIRGRHEYRRAPHAYVFGQVEHLRDTFKDIDYLVAPAIGMGYKVHETETRALALDFGVGAKIEKNMARRATTSGAVTANQRWRRQLSSHAAVTQSLGALWTADRFDDALYTLKVGITADLTRRSQIRLEVVDLYKTRPPTAMVEKNDVSAVTALVYKF